jgi:hypothetical protein
MKKLGVALLGLCAAFSLHAQDPAAEAPPADAATTESAPADAPTEASGTDTSTADAPVEVVPVEGAATESAPVEGSDTAVASEPAPAEGSADAGATDTSVPVESSGTDEPSAAEALAAAEERKWVFYVGADYGRATVSISDLPGFTNTDADTDVVEGRVGMRLTESIGVEAHYSQGLDDEEGGAPEPLFDYSYGIYIVPTGVLLDVVEFAFPLGYAFTSVKSGSLSEDLHSASYGVNIEFPFKVIADTLPDIRIVGGGMVYQQDSGSRVYGWHAGVRFDFGV